MKKCIMVGYEEEKLLALRMYAEQRGVSVEEELAQAAEAMYQKVVPANVRAFVDMKVESQKPKRKGIWLGGTMAKLYVGSAIPHSEK